MLSTLGEAKQSSLANIAGVNVNGPRFIQRVNDCTRRLMTRGDWEGTILPIQVCSTGGCVVWPRYVGSVRKLNVCKQPVLISSVWYNFLPWSQSCWNDRGWCNSWCGSGLMMTKQTHSPTFSSVAGENRLVRAYSSTPLDNNKTITLFGEDNNGQPLTTIGAGGWKDGITLTLNAPYVSTAAAVRRIDRVLKDKTQGPVRLYGWDVANSVLEDVAVYEPGETNPSYLRTQLNISSCGSSCSQSVVALVKLQFVPVAVDTDLVLIENLDALKLMFQCASAEEASDRKGAREFEQDAVRELNLSLSDSNPDYTTPVSIEPFSGACIGGQRLF